MFATVNTWWGLPESPATTTRTSIMKTVDVLIAAKALIANPAAWQWIDPEAPVIPDASKWPPSPKKVLGPGRIVGNIYGKQDGSSTLKRSEATCFCSLGAVCGALDLDVISSTDAFGQLIVAPLPEYDDSGVRKVSRKGLILTSGFGSDSVSRLFAASGLRKPKKSELKTFIKARNYLEAAGLQLFYNGVIAVNDDTTHAKVMAMFDLAIHNAKRRHLTASKGVVAKFAKTSVNTTAPAVRLGSGVES